MPDKNTMFTGSTSPWPQGYRSAAVITIDFNDIYGILTQAPAVEGRDKTLSVWRYGTLRGVDRLLNLLAKKQVKTTWCLPAIVAQEQPLLLERILAEGHEVACAGDQHEDFSAMSLEEQVACARRATEKLTALCGRAPRGFRTPAGQWKPGFAQALSGMGFQWSSCWRGDDLPYFHPGTPLVELPLHYELEDEPYFAFNLSPAVPPGQSRIASYQETLANMTQDFYGYHRFGLCYLLRLHPEIMGTAGRISLLEALIDTLQQQPVWLTTAESVAEHWRSSQPANTPDHPAEIFQRLWEQNHG